MAMSRLKLPTPQKVHGDTGLIARVSGVLYAAGAVLVTASLLLPHPSDSNDTAILAIAVLRMLGLTQKDAARVAALEMR